MIFNNNIKQFTEASKSNVDRLIISSHFDSHLTLNQIIRTVWAAHRNTVSAEHVTQTITKYTIIMAELNQKANNTAAPFIKQISSDELYLRKFHANQGILCSTHDIFSGYTIGSYLNKTKNAPSSADWENAIHEIKEKGLNPETMRTDLGAAIFNTHKLYDNFPHFADTWHTIERVEKVRNGIIREVKYAQNAIANNQKQFLKFIDPKTTDKAKQKLTNSHDKTTYTQEKLDNFNKALLHIDICIELFYSQFLKPSIMTPERISTNYDTIIGFIEEVHPCYPTETCAETIRFLKRNKDKILAFTHYLQEKFSQSYQKEFKHKGISFNDFWLTIAAKQYNQKNKQRMTILNKLEEKYGAELLKAMCEATGEILSKMKLTTQITEGYHANIAKYCRYQKELSQAKFDAYNFHLNHVKMHNPKRKSRKGKSRFEVCTGIKHDDWLDMVMGHKMRVFRCYVDADHKKQEVVNQRFAA
jgi:hypothetical protein